MVRAMKDVGYPKISPDDLVPMRIHGVDADVVKIILRAGWAMLLEVFLEISFQ